MTETAEPQLGMMAPVFKVQDMAASLAYYKDRLLFDIRFEWSDTTDGPVLYAIVGREKVELHLTQVADRQPAKAYCFTDGIDGYHAAVQSAGANITEDIGNQPWDMREFETADPDGNVLMFGEHLSRVTG